MRRAAVRRIGAMSAVAELDEADGERLDGSAPREEDRSIDLGQDAARRGTRGRVAA